MDVTDWHMTSKFGFILCVNRPAACENPPNGFQTLFVLSRINTSDGHEIMFSLQIKMDKDDHHHSWKKAIYVTDRRVRAIVLRSVRTRNKVLTGQSAI